MKKYTLIAALIIFSCKSDFGQEINPLDFFPYHVGDIWQYIEYPSGILHSGGITRIDTIDANTHLVYYEKNEIPSIKVILDSAIIFADSASWFPWYKLSYPVGAIWVRDNTTSWWVHFKTQYIDEVFNENMDVREYHIYEFIPPGDTNGLPGQVDYLVKGIGRYRITWEGGEILLNGCVINGIEYGTLVSVENESRTFEQFELKQNYPNPFNPVTTIRYEIPERSYVMVRVFDVLGNEVATLVNEEKPAGEYKVEFDGSGLTSGIYFYQIQAGNFIETKKMILLK